VTLRFHTPLGVREVPHSSSAGKAIPSSLSVDDEEDSDGIFCVGAAFFDHRGACAGAR
jgi:hypothetical protein